MSMSEDRSVAEIYQIIRSEVQSFFATTADAHDVLAALDTAVTAKFENLVIVADEVVETEAPTSVPTTQVQSLEDGVFQLVLSLVMTRAATMGLEQARRNVQQYLESLIAGLDPELDDRQQEEGT